jgi:hypothetical protein
VTGGRPMPRAVAWAAVAILAVIIMSCVMLLTGCGDPCAGHGGTVNLNKGVFTCADGTVK